MLNFALTKTKLLLVGAACFLVFSFSLFPFIGSAFMPTLQEGDLVLRLIQRTAGQHKLSAPWEGPFIISKVLGNDSYYLIDTQKP